jgi:hypothetical protein
MEWRRFVVCLRMGPSRRSQPERQLACQYLEKCYGESKNVRRRADRQFKALFRRHVGRGSIMAGPAPVAPVPCGAKIE